MSDWCFFVCGVVGCGFVCVVYFVDRFYLLVHLCVVCLMRLFGFVSVSSFGGCCGLWWLGLWCCCVLVGFNVVTLAAHVYVCGLWWLGVPPVGFDCWIWLLGFVVWIVWFGSRCCSWLDFGVWCWMFVVLLSLCVLCLGFNLGLFMLLVPSLLRRCFDFGCLVV